MLIYFLEQKPAVPYDPAESMETLEEAKNYIRFLYAELQEMKTEREEQTKLLEEMCLELKEARKQNEKKNESESRLLSNIERLIQELSDLRTENTRLTDLNKVLLEEIQVLKKHRYGSTFQKNKKVRESAQPDADSSASKDRNEEKDDFDGTKGNRPVESGSSSILSEEKHHAKGQRPRHCIIPS